MRTSTFVGNRAGNGRECISGCTSGAGGHGGAIYNQGQAQVYYSTAADNAAGNGFDNPDNAGGGTNPDGYGGAFYNEGTAFFEVRSTIAAHNRRSEFGAFNDLYGAFQGTSTNNLIKNTGGFSGLSDPSNNLGDDPELEPLADNGGQMPTRRPMATSPVLETGSCPGQTSDQRGYQNQTTNTRPVDSPADVDTIAECDVGAVELGATPDRLATAIRVFLEGPYSSSTMTTDLNPYIPSSQPYNTAPWDYDGTESVTTVPQNAVDWVLVELAAGDPALPPLLVVGRRAGLLLSNGRIEDPDAPETQEVYFPDVPPGSYRIIVRHRNHLDLLTNNAFSISTSLGGVVNLTSSSVSAYGSDALKDMSGTGSGPYAMWAGDGEPDGTLQLLDEILYFAGTFSGTTGYLPGDYNMDGNVQALDFNLYMANRLAGASSQVP